MVEPRVEQLVETFRSIAATRMAGVPICHPGLRVQAVGFERLADEPGMALGILVTPWFMNLVRLPLDPTLPGALGERESARRAHGGHAFDFLGAFEAEIGPFESCSLFSPMAEFADHEAALATAREVLALLRAPAVQPTPAPAQAEPAPARRGFLFGRSAAEPRA